MIKIDFSNITSQKLGEEGLSTRQIDAYKGIIEDIHKDIQKRSKEDFYFMNLPFQDTGKVKQIASMIRENFDYFVVIGIGGSALGNQTIHEAVNGFDYNIDKKPKFFILDNVDPVKFSLVLEQIEIGRTMFNVITKSGSTTETIANFLVILNLLKTRLGDDWKKHIVITTDPERGFLRRLANQENIETLDIPPNLGGRFSVLSSVGLLSSAVCGIDIDQLLEGAKRGYELCAKTYQPLENPAYLIGLIHYIFFMERGKSISVMMSYDERLSSFVDWYRQLWAESLGKDGLGQTPVKAIGSVDQHSQLQLYIDGPKDKIITFLTTEDKVKDFTIEGDVYQELNYMKGKTLKEILGILMEGTKTALVKAKVPNITVSIDVLSPYNVGLLIYIYEMATGFSGLLYKINPFDQPAVEEGKKFAYGLLGREGFEDKLREYRMLSESNLVIEIV